MMDLCLDDEFIVNFMMGLWFFIECFFSFMVLSLFKICYGCSLGDNLVWCWLVCNIWVE